MWRRALQKVWQVLKQKVCTGDLRQATENFQTVHTWANLKFSWKHWEMSSTTFKNCKNHYCWPVHKRLSFVLAS